MSIFSLEGKSALVTGAATGLGQAISVALAGQGADVVITDRSEDLLAETAELLRPFGRRVAALGIDVRSLSQIRAGMATAQGRLGAIDILVNNAGINRPAPGLEARESEWDDHFNTNVRGGFFMAQAAAPAMIERKWGRIIFISSQSGLVGIPGQPIYCATKGAVIQLVQTLGLEWAKHGVTVNSVAPTFVETNLTRARLGNPEFHRFVLSKIPAGKLATPQDVAAAVVYLASEQAGMVNCDTLRVDGGWTAW